MTEVCRRLIKGHFDQPYYQVLNVFYEGHSQDGDGKSDERSSTNRDDPSSHTSDGCNHGSNGGNVMKKLTLAQRLIHLLHFKHSSELRVASAQLLFHMYMRENMLFSNAAESYIVTEPSLSIAEDLAKLGSLCDDEKLFVKMHTGEYRDSSQSLTDKLKEITTLCLLKDDPVEPHTCHQEIIYTTREKPVLYHYRKYSFKFLWFKTFAKLMKLS